MFTNCSLIYVYSINYHNVNHRHTFHVLSIPLQTVNLLTNLYIFFPFTYYKVIDTNLSAFVSILKHWFLPT